MPQGCEQEAVRMDSLILEVDSGNIVSLVKETVGRAKTEILATMHLDQEITSPLPTVYHQLLERKMSEGVILRRLGFGTRKDFEQVEGLYASNSDNYDFRLHEDVDAYQRMIIVDKEQLLERVKENLS